MEPASSFATPAATPGPQNQSPPRVAVWRIFERKERWGLSWRGRLIVAGLLALTLGLVFLGIHPFLAVTARADAHFLVVEGWIHEYAVRVAAEEFKTGSYQRAFTTGGPKTGIGGYIDDSKTLASLGAGRLRRAGVPDEAVQMVPARVMGRDRTYSSAVALRDWFRVQNVQVQRINVLTEDAHARRTRLLFQKAFGRNVEVGIIAVPNPDFDARHWWRYSEGVREVIGEGIAYIYARFIFSSP